METLRNFQRFWIVMLLQEPYNINEWCIFGFNGRQWITESLIDSAATSVRNIACFLSATTRFAWALPFPVISTILFTVKNISILSTYALNVSHTAMSSPTRPNNHTHQWWSFCTPQRTERCPKILHCLCSKKLVLSSSPKCSKLIELHESTL